MSITRIQKAFFALILVEAVPVAILGYFFPEKLDKAFSWVTMPPLHAQFVAAFYFFGILFMLGCLTAQKWVDVRLAIPLTVIWTGVLIIVSIYHLEEFEWAKLPVKIWLIAYAVDPLIGIWLMVQKLEDWKLSRSDLSQWIRGYLFIQGIIFSLLALMLLFFPNTMVDAWAWKINATLAQFYAGPMLAYGVASLLLGWQGTWGQLEIVAPAMLVFTAAALISSYKQRELFSSHETADILWFAGFGIATLAHLILTFIAFQPKKR